MELAHGDGNVPILVYTHRRTKSSMHIVYPKLSGLSTTQLNHFKWLYLSMKSQREIIAQDPSLQPAAAQTLSNSVFYGSSNQNFYTGYASKAFIESGKPLAKCSKEHFASRRTVVDSLYEKDREFNSFEEFMEYIIPLSMWHAVLGSENARLNTYPKEMPHEEKYLREGIEVVPFDPVST